ncbi:MAG: Lrp/AsnC family transcriptional regulator [Candidatus Altiarchaeota archaeon]
MTNKEPSEKLLELLEEDGRISVDDISTMTGLSKDEVEKTIKKLGKKGVIRGFKAIIDWKSFDGGKVSALIQVKVVPQMRLGFAKTCREISRDKRVLDVFVVTGEYDLMMLVQGENMEEISDFVTEKLAPRKEVVGTNTHIVLSEYKRAGSLMFDEKERRLPVS